MPKELQEVFADHFKRDDLEGAKKWIRNWMQRDDQVVVGHETEFGYTQRAMAGHVSDYLEGYTGTEPESYNGKYSTCYFNTKYGSVLFDAALTPL